MFFSVQPASGRTVASMVAALSLFFLAVALLAAPAFAQSQSDSQQQAPTAPPPPEAGGPHTEIGPMAVPKKKKEEAPPPEEPGKFKNPPGLGQYSLRVDVPLVNVPVLVTTKEGRFIPGLKAGNFAILEDGVPQKIASFNVTQDAPITAVLLVEFASTNWYFVNDALNASYAFAGGLKPEDWVAVMYYDIKPHILTDFTRDKRQIYSALRQLRLPMRSDTNLYDALYQTLDALDRVEGRKYLILVASGYDSFSKLKLDDVLKKIQATSNVTIFSIGTGQWLRTVTEPYQGAITRLEYLQADNQLMTFSRMTGGRAYFPKFQAALREIFADIAGSIRNQYILSYRPSNAKQDGTYRNIKVELIDGHGHPLKVRNEKGKELKYVVLAREGYKAKHEVE